MFGAGCIPTSGFFYLILTIHTSVYTGVALLIGLKKKKVTLSKQLNSSLN